jgi:hypothetical protein
MRGVDERNGALFSYVSLEERIPARHPLRKVAVIVNDALKALDREFAGLYAPDGRPSTRRSGCCGRRWCRSCSRSAPSAS